MSLRLGRFLYKYVFISVPIVRMKLSNVEDRYNKQRMFASLFGEREIYKLMFMFAKIKKTIDQSFECKKSLIPKPLQWFIS